MNVKERLDMAVVFLTRQGYKVSEVKPTRGVDIIAYNDKGVAIFFAVMPFKGRFFPMQPFKSKKGVPRLTSLMAGAARWMQARNWVGAYRFDAISVHEGNETLDHVINAARKELM